MKAELSRITRDISDNILKNHKPSFKIDPMRNVVTIEKLQKIDESFKNMGEKMGVIIKSDAIWNKVSVKEQSDRIKQTVMKRKLRL